MADMEKGSGPPNSQDAHATQVALPASQVARPASWKYRGFNVFGQTVWFASPPVQLFIVSMICFMCPGMFNALNGVGGVGFPPDAHYVSDNSNTALYACFSVVGFFAGTFTNRLGVKASLSFGGLGYCIYISSFLCFKHTSNVGYAYFAGALLGVCAGLLWAAQGAVMMSYPPEASKGRYISWFWMIFNFGAVIGGFIPLGQNFHSTGSETASDGTYIGFMVLTFVGAALAWTMVNSTDVIRKDGSRVIVMQHPSWKSEIFGLYETFMLEPYVLLLFPMFWASNWFYTYQFNSVNGTKFDVRTRALNSILYWLAQIVGAFIFGFSLDLQHFRRKTKAIVAWGALFVLTMAIWGGGYVWQRGYTRGNVGTVYDWNTSGYVGPMFLYIFYGFFDAAWQTSVYWLMGALTNNGRRLANYAGFYKGIQSAGAAVAFRTDAQMISFMSQFISCWALLAGSLVIALPLLALKIRDHTPIEEDLRFSDETIGDVAPQRLRSSYVDDRQEKRTTSGSS